MPTSVRRLFEAPTIERYPVLQIKLKGTAPSDVQIANYGPSVIDEGSVRWSAATADGTETLGSGTVSATIPQGSVTSLGQIELDLAGVDRAQKIVIDLELEGTPYETEYPAWIYPSDVSTETPANVTVATQLDEATLEVLRQGGRVLLFPAFDQIEDNSVGGQFIPEFWNYGMFTQLAHQYGDPETDISVGTMGILTDPEHALFERFPTEFHSNWQWWPITKNSRPIVLDATADDYRPLVQVVDNGCGMSKQDALACFKRHATSKVSSVEDLDRIRTLGFRGEALASIAAVAQVELKTRLHDQAEGYRVDIHGGDVEENRPCATRPGTSVAVRNLFYNVPARRNFLKTPATEFKHIVETFQFLSLAYPEVEFTLGFTDDVQRRAVLDRAAGIAVLELGPQPHVTVLVGELGRALEHARQRLDRRSDDVVQRLLSGERLSRGLGVELQPAGRVGGTGRVPARVRRTSPTASHPSTGRPAARQCNSERSVAFGLAGSSGHSSGTQTQPTTGQPRS